MEMSHNLRACFTHHIVKAETQISKKCAWGELLGHILRYDTKSLEADLEEKMLNSYHFSK